MGSSPHPEIKRPRLTGPVNRLALKPSHQGPGERLKEGKKLEKRIPMPNMEPLNQNHLVIETYRQSSELRVEVTIN